MKNSIVTNLDEDEYLTNMPKERQLEQEFGFDYIIFETSIIYPHGLAK